MSTDRIELIKYVSRITQNDIESVGLYAQSLATLLSSGVPIPQSFVVTKEALGYFLDFSDLRRKLTEVVGSKSGNIRRVERTLLDATLPPVLKSAVTEAYHRVSGFSDSYVTIQPLLYTQETSLPLQQEKKKIALGEEGLFEALRRVWAEALCGTDTDLKAIIEDRVSISILVEKVPLEEVSGTMTTSDTITNHKENLLIEAVYGMWDIVEKEGIIPDQYVFSKKENKVLDKHVSKQPTMQIRQLFKNKTAFEQVSVSSIWQSMQKLSDKYLGHLASIGTLIEEYYKSPCDIKWTYEAGKLWIVSIDPLEKNLLSAKKVAKESQQEKLPVSKKPKFWAKTIKTKTIVARGIGNMAGFVEGVARKHTENVKRDENVILIATNGSKVDDLALQSLAGLVLDQGEQNDPILIRANMVGVSAVVGTGISTRVIRDGEKIWVDSVRGTVYTLPAKASFHKRAVSTADSNIADSAASSKTGGSWEEAITADRTATKLFLEVKAPSLTDLLQIETFTAHTDGVLLRYQALDPKQKSDPILSFIKSYHLAGKPAILAIDKRSELENAAKYLLSVRNGENLKATWCGLPPFSDLDTLVSHKHDLLDAGLRRSSTFKLFATIKSPSALFLESALFETGVDGIILEAEAIQKALSGRAANKLLAESAKPIADFIIRASKKRIEVFVNLGGLSLTKQIAELLVKSSVFGMTTGVPVYFPKLRNLIASVEHGLITNRRLNKRR